MVHAGKCFKQKKLLLENLSKYTVKKGFPVPRRDVTDQTLPGQE
jgi:hypothetical protein